MLIHGINVNSDGDFVPLYDFNKAYLEGAKRPVEIAVKGGHVVSKRTFIYGSEDKKDADAFYLNRLVKTMLWVYGGNEIFVSDKLAYDYIVSDFSRGAKQDFDVDFMSDVYEGEFKVHYGDVPPEKSDATCIGGGFDGCRIGFDAGGSDRKVSAVMDGKVLFSEEVVWNPKTATDIKYHYDGIVSAFKAAAAHLPRVDGVGVSSAGIYIANKTMRASLFLAVPSERREEVKDVYIRACRDCFGDVPLVVVNDGDVSALAGATVYNESSVLGIAMGTSEAGGFIASDGKITGWLNELAFVPIDVSARAAVDEWSGDVGCGGKYFSQDGVLNLLPGYGISVSGDTPAQKLEAVQKLLSGGDERAEKVFIELGRRLGHTLPFYYEIYGFKRLLLLGRVTSGKGGEIILSSAMRTLKQNYPFLDGKFVVSLPDENFRRVGQSMIAASLPVIK